MNKFGGLNNYACSVVAYKGHGGQITGANLFLLISMFSSDPKPELWTPCFQTTRTICFITISLAPSSSKRKADPDKMNLHDSTAFVHIFHRTFCSSFELRRLRAGDGLRIVCLYQMRVSQPAVLVSVATYGDASMIRYNFSG